MVLTGDNVGYTTAWALKDAGAEVTVVDLAPTAAGRRVPGVRRVDDPVRARAAAVSAVSIGPAGARSGQKVSCDLVVNACVQTPSTNLLAQAGAVGVRRGVAGLPPGRDAGSCLGGRGGGGGALAGGLRGAGRLAGLEAAEGSGHADAAAIAAFRSEAARSGDRIVLPPEASAASGKQFAWCAWT